MTQLTKLLSNCDHTDLRTVATQADIFNLIDDAIAFDTASVCIPPCYVREAVAYAAGRMPICTVIGFPNGYHSTRVKVFETEEAVKDGAEEIDMVINVGYLKSGNTQALLREIREVRAACQGKILKVIIEACLLTEEEKILACRLVSEAGADFIKTSTGFSSGGATAEDVRLLRQNVAQKVKVKAAGGIRTKEAAEEMLTAGADRLGASALVALAKKELER